jgi:hypothetical protein
MAEKVTPRRHKKPNTTPIRVPRSLLAASFGGRLKEISDFDVCVEDIKEKALTGLL